MDIAVLVKQIPDPSIMGDLNSEFLYKRDGKIVLDEADLYGVELALQLRDSAGSGEVTVITMAPDQEVVGVKNALAMGADRAIVISDGTLKGSHSLATAKVLNAAISKLENVYCIDVSDKEVTFEILINNLPKSLKKLNLNGTEV